MTPAGHVHDCTGPDQRCPCGFVFTLPPVSLAVEIRYRGEVFLDEAFMCDSIAMAAAGLRKAADLLELAQAAGATQARGRVQ